MVRKMKKIMMWILIAIVLATAVAAGTVGPLKYKDNVCYFWDKDRFTEQQDVFVDADYVGGEDLLGYVKSKETMWSKDLTGSSGVSWGELGEFLYGNKTEFKKFRNYAEFLEQKIESINLRIDRVEAMVRGIDPIQVTAERYGHPIKFADGTICDTFGCFKFEKKEEEGKQPMTEGGIRILKMGGTSMLPWQLGYTSDPPILSSEIGIQLPGGPTGEIVLPEE
jgi:hypothetical protein